MIRKASQYAGKNVQTVRWISGETIAVKKEGLALEYKGDSTTSSKDAFFAKKGEAGEKTYFHKMTQDQLKDIKGKCLHFHNLFVYKYSRQDTEGQGAGKDLH